MVMSLLWLFFKGYYIIITGEILYALTKTILDNVPSTTCLNLIPTWKPEILTLSNNKFTFNRKDLVGNYETDDKNDIQNNILKFMEVIFYEM